MAKCYPPNIFEYTKSSAEKKIFKILEKNKHAKNWIVLHSLGLPPGTSRDKYRFGEIDFVVLIPEFGIICIEAKSSHLKCENGVWTIFNRYKGNYEKLTKSPFQQAKDGMFKLNEVIHERLQDNHKTIWEKISNRSLGMHVMFPECSRPVLPSDINREDLTCYDDFNSDEEFVQRLIKSVNLQLNNSKQFEFKNKHFDQKLMKSIKQILRPDFQFVVKLSYLNKLVDEAICSFSTEQQDYLDDIEDNLDSKPKILFQGPPGTGKSFLAIELFKRVSLSHKVCFLYFNKLIKTSVQFKLENENMDNVNCFTIHDLMRKIVGQSSLETDYKNSIEGKNNKEVFDEILPRFAIAAIDDKHKFDFIIIDEAQDILSDLNLEFINSLLKNTFNESSLVFFGDFENQNIYKRQSLKNYNSFFDKFWKRTLKKNYRNTVNIGKYAAAFGEYDYLPFKLVTKSNLEPEIQYFSNEDDFILKISDIIKNFDYELIKQGIVFLSKFTLPNSLLHKVNFADVNFDLTILTEKNIHSFLYKKDQVYFSTLQGFKGLEASTIIYVDVDFNDTEESLYHFIALTRAKSNLKILINEKFRKKVQQIYNRLVEYDLDVRK
jgi:DNA replication protein DnaC